MKVKEVGKMYPELRKYLKKLKFDELFPPQEEAIRWGAIENNFILASGTGSGKSLVAYLSAFYHIERGKKVLYLVPLRALGFEKFRELQKFDVNVALALGDRVVSREELGSAEILVATYEKIESIFRTFPQFLRNVGRVIVDEIHEVSERPIVEVVISKLKGIASVLGLSATISNVEELANWLNAKYLVSDYRPVPLTRGIIGRDFVKWENGKRESTDFWSFLRKEISLGRKILVFTNSRKEAVKLASKALTELSLVLEGGDEDLAEIVENVLPKPTPQCRILARLMRRGIAFHHAGLHTDQRIAVEDAFLGGKISALFATPTLVAGVNLPASTVIIYRPNRRIWNDNRILQAFGRAGRPGFDEEGRALLYLPNVGEGGAIDAVRDIKPGEVHSSLVNPAILRKILLGLMVENCLDRETLENFASNTLFAYQTGNRRKIISIFRYWANVFIEWGFVATDGSTACLTEIGRKIARTFLDPLAVHLWEDIGAESTRELLFLIAISPDYERLNLEIKTQDLLNPYRDIDEKALQISRFYSEISEKTIIRAAVNAELLYWWLTGRDFDEIVEEFSTTPGDVYMALRNARWIAAGMLELSKYIGLDGKKVKEITLRLKYQVPPDLIELVEIPFIGAKRAQKLKSMGFTFQRLKRLDLSTLKSLLGEKIGERVYYFLRNKKAM